MYRVIIIEDSKLLRLGMIHTLAWKDYDCEIVGSAEDGISGLDLIRNVHPDIIITDIRMPGMTGLELAEKAREDGCNASIIIISGFDDFEYAKSAIGIGVVEYLVKPLQDEDVYIALQKACREVDQKRKIKGLEERINLLNESRITHFQKYINGRINIRNEYAQGAVEYIHKHYAENISMGKIAEELNISESHLSKVFRETLNMTMGEYLTNYRISEACKILADSKYRINEVAVKCGYNDQHYFSVIFKRIMGMTPNEFRNQKV